MLLPSIINGLSYVDERSTLLYNNNVNLASVKRSYIIENNIINPIRAWQGQKIEQRWFIAIVGNFMFKLIQIDDWNSPNKLLSKIEFLLNSNTFNILHVPPGYISCIESLELGSKLFVMSDYGFEEIEDDYRFPLDYFNI